MSSVSTAPARRANGESAARAARAMADRSGRGFMTQVPVHELRVTSIQDRAEPRPSDEGALVDQTEASEQRLI